MRSKWTRAAAAMLVAIVTCWVAQPALGIGQDRGWSQLANGGYPRQHASPECQPPSGTQPAPGCIAWSAREYRSYYYFITSAVPLQNDVIAAVTEFNNWNTRIPHAPLYQYRSTSPNIQYRRITLDATLCGHTAWWGVQQPPQGVNPYEHATITYAEVQFNTNRTYGNVGYYDNKVCEIRNTARHETLHTAGAGHTNYNSQVMYWSQRGIFTYQAGDLHGMQCMYNLQNCTTGL